MIRSTFAGFTTAQLAMAASQRALDVTGQNISNINTPGYTRQRLDITSLNTQKGDFYNSNSTIKVGFGVQMTKVSQLRDPFLDAQYRSQISKLGTSDAHVAGFEQLANIFDESVDEGVRAALVSISSSLSTLSTQAGNKEHDTAVRSNMQVLLNIFREKAIRLQDIREDMQSGFRSTDISDLNQILENIAELNTSIKNSQILGNPALELQDQRNTLLDELGSYLPISVKYRDETIGPDQTVEVLDVSFIDTNGQRHTLVYDGRYSTFDTNVTELPVTLTMTDANGNHVQLAGYQKDDKGNDVYTEILGSGTVKGTLDLLNKSGDFDHSDFRGLGYYEKALDKDRPLFTTKDGKTEGFTSLNIKIADGWLNGDYGITISNKLIDSKPGSTADENVLNMISLLEKGFDFEVPVEGGQPVKFFTGSFHDCFANIENTLGIDTKSENAMLTNHITVLNQTSNSRDGVSGVQLDEEGMNLLHFNQSYNAAARLMTTLDEALDKLINGTGVVGR